MAPLKKILVIRFSSIGDIVLTSPIIRALSVKAEFDIHVLTKQKFKGLYENNPHVSKVFSFLGSTKEVISDLINEEYHHVIDLQKNLRSLRLIKKLKIRSTTFPKLNIDKWLLVNFKINRLPEIHIVDRYFEAVRELGVINDGKGLEYYIPPVDEVAPELIDHRLKSEYIAFVIGGQHNTKIFPPEKASSLIIRLNMPVVLLGSDEDSERAKSIMEMTDDAANVINTCGTLNINQSASLVRSSELVITNDTGLMHIAAAFQKPIVSIWGNTVPEFGMYPYLPEHPDRFVISEVKNLKCRPCSKIGYNRCPKKHFKCMNDQDIDKIADSAEILLKKE